MSDFQNRSEKEEYIQRVTWPKTGEDLMIAARDWRSPINKYITNVAAYNAMASDERMLQAVYYNRELKPEQRAEQADSMRQELADDPKELVNVKSHQASPEKSIEFDESTPVEQQINELQVAISQQNEKIVELSKQLETHQENIQTKVSEWQEVHEKRSELFVDQLEEHFSNNYATDDSGDLVKVKIHDANGNEITFDKETDKTRRDDVTTALNSTPAPDKVHEFMKGKVTAEQCSKTGALTRAFNVVTAMHRLNPKSVDASSVHQAGGAEEIQSRIDDIREKEQLIERKIELNMKLRDAKTPEEKQELQAKLDKLNIGATKEEKANRLQDRKSDLLAALNRNKGIDPQRPGPTCKPPKTYERFDGKKTEQSKHEENDVAQIAGIFTECDARNSKSAELEKAKGQLKGMDDALKKLKDDLQEKQEHAPRKGSSA